MDNENKIAKLRYRVLATIADFIVNVLMVALILVVTSSVSIMSLFFGQTSVINLPILIKLVEVGVLIATYFTIYFVIIPLYTKGQTLGYWLFKIRVVQNDGKNVTFMSMFVRSMLGQIVFNLITLGVGVIVSSILMVYRKDHCAIHDVLAKTIVVDAQGG